MGVQNINKIDEFRAAFKESNSNTTFVFWSHIRRADSHMIKITQIPQTDSSLRRWRIEVHSPTNEKKAPHLFSEVARKKSEPDAGGYTPNSIIEKLNKMLEDVPVRNTNSVGQSLTLHRVEENDRGELARKYEAEVQEETSSY